MTGSDQAHIQTSQPAWRQSAQYRFTAQKVYSALLTESCEADASLARSKVLSVESMMVRRFEDSARLTSPEAVVQLAIARSDVELEMAGTSPGCWNDSDSDFAQLHVGMAREMIYTGLAQLEELEPELVALGKMKIAPAQGAAFRAIARKAVDMLQPPCALSSQAADDEILKPARMELSQFKRQIQGTPWEIHFTIAEADARYLQSITVSECSSAPTMESAEVERARFLEETRKLVSSMSVISTGQPGRS